MGFKANLEPDRKENSVIDGSFKDNFLVLLEEEVFLFLPTHKKARTCFDHSLFSVPDSVLFWFYSRLHHLELFQSNEIDTFQSQSGVVTEVEFSQCVVHLFIRKVISALRKKFQVVLAILVTILTRRNDHFEDLLVEEGGLFNFLLLLDLHQENLTQLGFFVEVDQGSQEVIVVLLTFQTTSLVELS